MNELDWRYWNAGHSRFKIQKRAGADVHSVMSSWVQVALFSWGDSATHFGFDKRKTKHLRVLLLLFASANWRAIVSIAKSTISFPPFPLSLDTGQMKNKALHILLHGSSQVHIEEPLRQLPKQQRRKPLWRMVFRRHQSAMMLRECSHYKEDIIPTFSTWPSGAIWLTNNQQYNKCL